MKGVVFMILFLSVAETLAQGKLSTTSGKITFVSRAQLEMIRAASDMVTGKIDPASNQFAFKVPVKSFKGFNTELQREHFNDNYLQSDQFPSASFSGKIIEEVDFTADGTYDVRAKGNLDIHGQKQTRIIKAKLVIRNRIVTIDATFTVPLADHNITIPRIVNQKIATGIEVNFSATLTPDE